MENKKSLLVPFIAVLLLGLVSLVVTISGRHYETHYNALLQLIVVNASYIFVGMIIGLEYIVKQYFAAGVWHLNKVRIAVLIFPLFLLYLALSINLFNIYLAYSIIINDFFKQALGILIGYYLITSVFK